MTMPRLRGLRVRMRLFRLCGRSWLAACWLAL